MTRRRAIAWPLMAAVLGLGLSLPGDGPLAGMDRAKRIQAMKGVVLLIALKKQGNKLVPVGRGSGSIIDSSGLILTNNHVVADPKTGAVHDVVAVALTSSFDKVPKPSCLAIPSRAIRRTDLDLAVVKCEAEVNGRPLRRAITWPAVELGDSTKVVPGDDLFIVGYPGIGGMTITFSAGKSSGFLSDPKLGSRAWIKTDALISPGVSGGSAFDEDGKLIGVPTQLRWRSGGRTTIGMVRPIAKARPLIDAVRGKDWKTLPRAAAPARPTRTSAGLRVQLGPLNIAGALAEAAVRKPLAGTLPGVNACYLEALKRNNRLAGYMDLRLAILASGRGQARLARSTITDRTLVTCVGRVIGGLTFPASSGNTVANVLLVFLGAPAGARPSPTPTPTPTPTPAPAPTPRASVGVSYVTGQLVDASTGQPIAGAAVLVLKAGVRVASLTRSTLNQQVATAAISTSAGHFRTKHALARGKSHGILFMARGYNTVAVDAAVRLLQGSPAVINLGRLRLRRRVY